MMNDYGLGSRFVSDQCTVAASITTLVLRNHSVARPVARRRRGVSLIFSTSVYRERTEIAPCVIIEQRLYQRAVRLRRAESQACAGAAVRRLRLVYIMTITFHLCHVSRDPHAFMIFQKRLCELSTINIEIFLMFDLYREFL